MALSKIDICNRALEEVPARTIAAFDEASNEAKECRRAYDPTKSLLLASNPMGWSFAVERVYGAPTTNTRSTEWAYAFAIDAERELLRIEAAPEALGNSRPLYGNGLGALPVDGRPPYLVSGDTVFTNVERPLLCYRAIEITEDRMSRLFQEAMIWRLAAALVLPLTKDRMHKRDLENMAQLKLTEALCDDWNRAAAHSYGEHVPDLVLARI